MSRTLDEETVVLHGDIWSVGWDIPTRWAIDSDGQCWMDNAHGHAKEPVARKALLNAAQSNCEATHRKISKHFGLKPPMPAWERLALANGWTPPIAQG